ncbi:hypothetical protein K1719_003101 [Acacia pycnantha]|nr:hypothetical protein K1719_003101 [Acacia pycnantha]
MINQVVYWLQLPKLPARYYHKSIICSIGSVFDEVIQETCKFASIAVLVDLTKPLTSTIMVDGELIYVEHEGLPTTCFYYGRYGHLQEFCSPKMAYVMDFGNEQP